MRGLIQFINPSLIRATAVVIQFVCFQSPQEPNLSIVQPLGKLNESTEMAEMKFQSPVSETPAYEIYTMSSPMQLHKHHPHHHHQQQQQQQQQQLHLLQQSHDIRYSQFPTDVITANIRRTPVDALKSGYMFAQPVYCSSEGGLPDISRNGYPMMRNHQASSAFYSPLQLVIKWLSNKRSHRELLYCMNVRGGTKDSHFWVTGQNSCGKNGGRQNGGGRNGGGKNGDWLNGGGQNVKDKMIRWQNCNRQNATDKMYGQQYTRRPKWLDEKNTHLNKLYKKLFVDAGRFSQLLCVDSHLAIVFSQR